MRDPHPENIDGRKVQRHVFKHEIQWGYVALALVVLVVAVQFSGRFASDEDQEVTRPA